MRRFHASRRPSLPRTVAILVLMLCGIAVVWFMPTPEAKGIAGYLPLHIMLETVSITVAALVFAVSWSSRWLELPGNVILIGCAFLFVAVTDFSHTLSFAGMSDYVTPSGPEKAINFWLVARIVAALALLAVVVLPWRPFASRWSPFVPLAGFVALAVVTHLVLLWHPEVIPRTFVPGAGLTPLKIGVEYAIVAINVVTAFILVRRMRGPLPYSATALLGAVCAMAMSEFLFTLYADVTDVFNLLGHVYKVISYVFLYEAVFVSTVRRPYLRLQESQDKLQGTLDALPDLLFEIDADGRLYDVNVPCARTLAIPPEALAATTVHEHLSPGAADVLMAATTEARDTGFSQGRQYVLQTVHGPRWYEISVARKGAPTARNPHYVVLSHDIAPRRAAEHEAQRLANLYEALSKCNEAIVRAGSVHELLPIICHDVVELGGMTMAWIRFTDGARDAGHRVASHRSGTEILDGLPPALEGPFDAAAYAPAVLAMAQDEPVWCQDFMADPLTAAWREAGERFGWGASAALPLHRDGAVIGSFSLHAQEVGAFDERARNLLIEMSMDLDFALQNFERERLRGLAEDALRRSEAELNVAQSIAQVGSWSYDVASGRIDASPECCRMFDIAPRDLTIEAAVATIHPDDHDGTVRQVLEGTSFEREFRIVVDEQVRWISARVKAENDADGRLVSVLGTTQDVTTHKAFEDRIYYLAHFDTLTGLPNRSQLEKLLDGVLSVASSGERVALMYIDLDRFKDVNDTLGHSAGDALLVQLADRLRAALRDEDVLSRLGGDEFIVMVPRTDPQRAAVVAQKLLDVIAEPSVVDGYHLSLSASIGIALYPDDGTVLESLSKSADVAMYRAKQDGRSCFRFFTAELQERSSRNLQIVNDLRSAVERDELHLVYQPQIALHDGALLGVEALLRWEHPGLGPVAPSEFIPIAEDSGTIMPIGEWVLRSAVKQLKAWLDAGLQPMVMSVNLSAVQFRDTDLAEMICRLLVEEGLPAEYLELELTERVAMYDPKTAIAVMDGLHERGIRLALDDFGTGYSSLSYLKEFKIYKLKIDRSFVQDISFRSDSRAIVTTIVNIAQSLGLRTIAEGAETAEQVEFLREQGCDEIQGFYFSRPLPANELVAFARARRPLPAITAESTPPSPSTV